MSYGHGTGFWSAVKGLQDQLTTTTVLDGAIGTITALQTEVANLTTLVASLSARIAALESTAPAAFEARIDSLEAKTPWTMSSFAGRTVIDYNAPMIFKVTGLYLFQSYYSDSGVGVMEIWDPRFADSTRVPKPSQINNIESALTSITGRVTATEAIAIAAFDGKNALANEVSVIQHNLTAAINTNASQQTTLGTLQTQITLNTDYRTALQSLVSISGNGTRMAVHYKSKVVRFRINTDTTNEHMEVQTFLSHQASVEGVTGFTCLQPQRAWVNQPASKKAVIFARNTIFVHHQDQADWDFVPGVNLIAE